MANLPDFITKSNLIYLIVNETLWAVQEPEYLPMKLTTGFYYITSIREEYNREKQVVLFTESDYNQMNNFYEDDGLQFFNSYEIPAADYGQTWTAYLAS